MPALTAIVGYAGAVTALYTALLLIIGRHRAQVRIFGGAFFFLFAIILFLFTLFLINRYQTLPHLAFTHLPTAMLVGPAVYLFLRFAANPEFPLRPYLLLHLVLPVAVTIYMSDVYALSAEVKQRMLAHSEPLPEYVIPRLRAVFIFVYCTPLIYFSISVRHAIPFFTRTTSGSLGFLRAMRWFLLICAAAILMMLATLVGGDWFYVKFTALSLFSLAVLFAFGALARNPHFPEFLARDARRYNRLRHRGRGDARADLERLTQLVGEERLFANARLRVADVAAELGLRGDQLSQLINDAYGINFNRFINRVRIAEVKRRLAKRPQESILRIAYECGFNAKSAFNTAFKLETGVNPTAYLRSLKE